MFQTTLSNQNRAAHVKIVKQKETIEYNPLVQDVHHGFVGHALICNV